MNRILRTTMVGAALAASLTGGAPIWASTGAGGLDRSGQTVGQAPALKIEANTTVRFTLGIDLESGVSAKGMSFPLTVSEDVTDTLGRVLILKGTEAHGTVTWSRKGNPLGGIFNQPPRLEISIDDVKAVDGSTLTLKAAKLGGAGKSLSIDDALRLAIGNPLDIIKRIGDLIVGHNIKAKAGMPLVGFVAETRELRPDVARTRTFILTGGDTVTGVVLREEGAVYVVSTSFGTLRINKSDVVRIEPARV